MNRDDLKSLEREAEGIDGRLRTITGDLDLMQKSPDFQNLERNRSEIADQVTQLVQLETQGNLYLRQTERIAAGLSAAEGAAPVGEEALREADNDPILMQLLSRRQALWEQLAQWEKRDIGRNHPNMKELDAALTEVNVAIHEKRAAVAKQGHEDMIRQAQANYMGARTQLDTIQAGLEEARKKKYKLELDSARYNELQREKTQLEQQRNLLTERLREIEVKLNLQVPQMEVAIHAVTPQPRDISFPRWEFFLAGGLVLGLVLGIGLALVLELVDTSVRDPARHQRTGPPAAARLRPGRRGRPADPRADVPPGRLPRRCPWSPSPSARSAPTCCSRRPRTSSAPSPSPAPPATRARPWSPRTWRSPSPCPGGASCWWTPTSAARRWRRSSACRRRSD